MKTLLVIALLGAVIFAAVQADDDSSEESSKKVVSSSNESEEKGVAGFPLYKINGWDWKDKVKKIVKTFNEYAGSTSAYTVKKSGNRLLVTGNIITVTADGNTRFLEGILIDQYGRVKAESGEKLGDVRGIVGGEEKRLNNLSKNALKKITKGFKKGDAFLSSLPNDFWIFGETKFKEGATIAFDTAKMLTQTAEDIWTETVPLGEADKCAIQKIYKHGINLAVEPTKLILEGAGAGFQAIRDLTGIAAGVPLAVGSSVFRTGADIVSTGAGIVGRMADGAYNVGRSWAFNQPRRQRRNRKKQESSSE